MNRPLRISVMALAAALVGLAAKLHFPLCPLASSTGIPCPGCGLTRATLALLRGDVQTALQIHPLVWLLSPLFFGFIAAAVLELLRDPASPRRRSRIRWNSAGMNAAATLLLVLTLGVWLARFAGHFGGPVKVTSLHDWLTAHR